MKHSSLAMLSPLLVAASTLVAAQEKHYEGDVVAVDTKAHTFTVKGTEKGETAEMKFHLDKSSAIAINGERKLFAELANGDHVRVTYGSTGMVHSAKNVERRKTGAKEMIFAGEIVDVDANARTFTVKRSVGGKVEEMKFYVKPTTRMYVGAEQEFLVQQLRKGDEVSVNYESASGEHLARVVGKSKKAT